LETAEALAENERRAEAEAATKKQVAMQAQRLRVEKR